MATRCFWSYKPTLSPPVNGHKRLFCPHREQRYRETRRRRDVVLLSRPIARGGSRRTAVPDHRGRIVARAGSPRDTSRGDHVPRPKRVDDTGSPCYGVLNPNQNSLSVHIENYRMTTMRDHRQDEATTVLSVDKTLSIVELLMREAAPLTAREIAERLGINRTTTHRLLNAVIHRGWVEKAAGTASYRLNLRFLALARLSIGARDFVTDLRPALERLSLLSRETVHLGIMDGFEIVHIDRVESPERVGISSKMGSRAVPHVTGLGKAILAASADGIVDDYLQHARQCPPPYTVLDAAPLQRELQLTRERGYSVDNEEDSIGVRCLGVAIRGAGGAPLFAISLTGPSPRFTSERLEGCAPDVVAIARALSIQFGWEPGTESA